ncbi:hypothetical protein GCM10010129_47070 [Streptomyces fumigatiscleroticus]|nr:hypothetical protein GCM10010129_47070 [Streptomyces fumigatiscleroticus]
MHSDHVDLTQEVLAQMLAVRRTSVSEVAGALAEDGRIQYGRGTITVLDRARWRPTRAAATASSARPPTSSSRRPRTGRFALHPYLGPHRAGVSP